jgi:NAD(P)H dehydrogenase (quinone)
VRLRKVAELVAEPPTTDREAWSALRATTHDVPEATLDDLEWADALMFGTPVRFGLPAPQLTHFVDTTAALSIAGKLANKPVTVFASGSAAHGGQETATLALHNSFCHWGSLIVSTGSTEQILYRPTNGNPYGAGNVSHNKPGNVDEDNLAAVEFQARRVVEIAAALGRGFAHRD